jgi:tetratricopeptide (TPR) repeat protein/DNA-binding SARP family transcriptional activator
VAGRAVGGSLRPRERAVLATMLTRPNVPISSGELIDWVWGDNELPQHPTSALSTNVSRVRKLFNQLAVDADLQVDNGTHCLAVAKDTIDHHVFRDLVSQARELGRQGDHQKAADTCETALELWRGEPLADVASERANAWRVGFVHNEWLPANILLIEFRLRISEFDRALSRLDNLMEYHPHETRLTALRMSALHGLGRGDEATALYLGTARRLRAEGDEHAALFLRRHQDVLTAPLAEQSPVSAWSRTTVRPPRLLPPAITGFVGRAKPLSQLNTALSSVAAADGDHPIRGVVSVDGMAGVGKTALVLHWGHHVRGRFPGGTLYANLGGFSDREPVSAANVVNDFLIALEHPPQADSSLRHRQVRLGKLLADRSTLVVLDNARNTDQIHDLLPPLADSFVVVTSRQQLTKLSTMTGAQRVHVEPMPPAESAALLARHVKPGLLDESTVHQVHDLCEGLPLVLRLLADHLDRHSDQDPVSVLENISRHQLITTIGETGDGANNASALFRQSYLALPPPERRLLRLLAVCPGPDFHAATSCACDGRTPDDTTRSLGILVGAHLLNGPDHLGRYRFHDLLAEFAAHRLDTDETEISRRDTERRVLTFYLHTALQAAGHLYPSLPKAPPLPRYDNNDVLPVPIPNRERARQWFTQERTSLVAAVTMATEHGHHPIAWRLADPVATDFDRCGYLHDSRVIREHAVASARIDGHQLAEASTLVGLGMSHMLTADHHQARDCFTTALRLVEEHHDDRGQAAILHQLGRLEALADNNSAALHLYRRSLDIATRSGDIEIQTWANCRIGHVLRALDQHGTATIHFHRAATLAESVNERSAQSSSLAGLAGIFLDRGDLDTATTHCVQALEIAESVPDLAVTAAIHLDLADIALARRDNPRAMTHTRRALEICDSTHNTAIEARAHHTLATVHHVDGRPDQALPHWQTAATLYHHTGNTQRADHVLRKANTHAPQGPTVPTTRSADHPIPAKESDTDAGGTGHTATRATTSTT